MSATSVPPTPFPDDDAPLGVTILSDKLPGSAGGFIESTKTAIIVGLMEALTASSITRVNDSRIHVDLEWPQKKTQFPGIWVQFSIVKMDRAGVSQEWWVQDDDSQQWWPIQEWMFEGRITLTVVALTSLERDRLSDALIMQLAFARTPNLVITKSSDTKENRTLISNLDKNPYINMTLNTDTIVSGGQSAAQGTQWDNEQMVYEDSYSFDCLGHFQVQFKHDGTYNLRAFDIEEAYNPHDWQ